MLPLIWKGCVILRLFSALSSLSLLLFNLPGPSLLQPWRCPKFCHLSVSAFYLGCLLHFPQSSPWSWAPILSPSSLLFLPAFLLPSRSGVGTPLTLPSVSAHCPKGLVATLPSQHLELSMGHTTVASSWPLSLLWAATVSHLFHLLCHGMRTYACPSLCITQETQS